MIQLAKFLRPPFLASPQPSDFTSRDVFVTFSTDTHGVGNANSGTQDFFVFIGPHTSGEIPDNYVKYLGWIPDWKSSKDRLIIYYRKA